MKGVLEENKGASVSLARPTKPFTFQLRMIFYVILIAHFLRGVCPTVMRQQSGKNRQSRGSVSQSVTQGKWRGLKTKEEEGKGEVCSALLPHYVHISCVSFLRDTWKKPYHSYSYYLCFSFILLLLCYYYHTHIGLIDFLYYCRLCLTK